MSSTISKSVTLGAGCFWGTEKYIQSDFQKKFPGSILNGKVGFMSPYEHHLLNPTYQNVCRGNTGHVQVYRFELSDAHTYFREVIKFFFMFHDPTTKDRQGDEIGTQYASTIFVADQEQRRIAEEVIYELQYLIDSQVAAPYTGTEIQTAVHNATIFYEADNFHQEYLKRNPKGYCPHYMRMKNWPTMNPCAEPRRSTRHITPPQFLAQQQSLSTRNSFTRAPRSSSKSSPHATSNAIVIDASPETSSPSSSKRTPNKTPKQDLSTFSRRGGRIMRYTLNERLHFLNIIKEQGKVPSSDKEWGNVASLHNKKWLGHVSEEKKTKLQRSGCSLKLQFLKLLKQKEGSESTNLPADVQLVKDLQLPNDVSADFADNDSEEGVDDSDHDIISVEDDDGAPSSTKAPKTAPQQVYSTPRMRGRGMAYTVNERLHFLTIIKKQGKVPISKKGWAKVASLHNKKWFGHFSEEKKEKVQRSGNSLKSQFMKLLDHKEGSESTNLPLDVQLAMGLPLPNVCADCTDNDSEECVDDSDHDYVTVQDKDDNDAIDDGNDKYVTGHSDTNNTASSNDDNDSIQRFHIETPTNIGTSVPSNKVSVSTTSAGNIENINAAVGQSMDQPKVVLQHQNILPSIGQTGGTQSLIPIPIAAAASITDIMSQFLVASQLQREEDRRIREEERREERRIREEENRRRDEENRRRDEENRRREADDRRRFEMIFLALADNRLSRDSILALTENRLSRDNNGDRANN